MAVTFNGVEQEVQSNCKVMLWKKSIRRLHGLYRLKAFISAKSVQSVDAPTTLQLLHKW